MRHLIQTTEVYRIGTEPEVQNFINELKEQAREEGYILRSCNYTLKEKKAKGEIIDSAYQVKIVKDYNSFWEV